MSAAYEAAPLEALTASIEAQVSATRDLVEATQAEQAHLLAFDVPSLSAATTRRIGLIDVVERCNTATRAAFEAARNGHPDAVNVRALAHLVGDVHLADRANALRALTAALVELNAITMVHTKRSVGTAKAYAALLTRGPAGITAGAAYTRTGRATLNSAAGGRIVLRSV